MSFTALAARSTTSLAGYEELSALKPKATWMGFRQLALPPPYRDRGKTVHTNKLPRNSLRSVLVSPVTYMPAHTDTFLPHHTLLWSFSSIVKPSCLSLKWKSLPHLNTSNKSHSSARHL